MTARIPCPADADPTMDGVAPTEVRLVRVRPGVDGWVGSWSCPCGAQHVLPVCQGQVAVLLAHGAVAVDVVADKEWLDPVRLVPPSELDGSAYLAALEWLAKGDVLTVDPELFRLSQTVRSELAAKRARRAATLRTETRRWRP